MEKVVVDIKERTERTTAGSKFQKERVCKDHHEEEESVRFSCLMPWSGNLTEG